MDHPPAGRSAQDLDLWRHDLGTTLTVISGYTHLLQRQVLRASGLTDGERETMLATHAALLAPLQRLGTQIVALIRAGQEPPPPPSSAPFEEPS